METVEALRQKIAQALLRREPTDELERELAGAIQEQKVDEAVAEELAKARELATKHESWQDKAAEIRERVEKQSKAVARLLNERDKLKGPLCQARDKLKELLAVSADAGGGYRLQFSFEEAVRSIPREYFPEGFTCSWLHRDDKVSGFGDEPIGVPLMLLENAIEILEGLHEVKSSLTANQLTASGWGESAEPTTDSRCTICTHPQREAIERAIKAGMPLRDIEEKYGVSKSALGRHKQHLAG